MGGVGNAYTQVMPVFVQAPLEGNGDAWGACFGVLPLLLPVMVP
jgi:hypothetical protein